MSGIRQIVLVGAVLVAGVGVVNLRAQTVLGDPKDAAKTFASNCSACHKSPQGLAKSGQVAGFLRQHYTTGPEMSAAMAAYLVAAGSAPAAKKGAAPADASARIKGKKQEQVSAVNPAAETAHPGQRKTLRGKQLPPEQTARPAEVPAAEEHNQTAATAALSTTQAATTVAQPAPQPAVEPPLVFDIPLPPMPDAPPPELTQSAFSSAPLP